MTKPENLSSAFADLSFGQAVEKCVFGDAAVRDAIHLAEQEAVGEKPNFRKHFVGRNRVRIDPPKLAGTLAASTGPKTLEELSAEWNRGSPHPRFKTPRIEQLASVKAAWRAVLERYMQLIDRLATGELVVTGVHPDTGERTIVDRTYWNDPKLFVDFGNDELSLGVVRSKRKVVARGMMFATADPQAQDKTRATGGRPAQYPWEEGFEQLAIRVGREGHPEHAATLARWLLDGLDKAGCDSLPSEDQAVAWLKKHYRRLWDHVAGDQTGGGQNQF